MRATLAAIFVLWCGPGTACAQVELRGQATPLAADVVDVSIDGVQVRNAAGETFIVGWDRVRRVRGDFAGDADRYAVEADRAWRARARLLRGDAVAAEPLYEELFLTYEGRRGPTAAAVAEGLLRCRLRRGVQASAVGPWLALLRAGGVDQPAIAEVQTVVDRQTGLAPMLPPIWLSGPPVEALAREGAGSEQGPGDRVAALRAWYVHAAAFESGSTGSTPALPASMDSGLMLVSRVVLARTGNVAERTAARQWLNDQAARSPETWEEAWCRAAIGRSLVLESAEDERRLGVISLLHVPARFEREQPFLAGVCLAEAAQALRGLGDEAGGRRLMQELSERFPGHPALAWEQTRDLLPRGGGLGAADGRGAFGVVHSLR